MASACSAWGGNVSRVGWSSLVEVGGDGDEARAEEETADQSAEWCDEAGSERGHAEHGGDAGKGSAGVGQGLVDAHDGHDIQPRFRHVPPSRSRSMNAVVPCRAVRSASGSPDMPPPITRLSKRRTIRLVLHVDPDDYAPLRATRTASSQKASPAAARVSSGLVSDLWDLWGTSGARFRDATASITLEGQEGIAIMLIGELVTATTRSIPPTPPTRSSAPPSRHRPTPGAAQAPFELPGPSACAPLLDIPDGVSQAGLIPAAYSRGEDFRPGPRRSLDAVAFHDRWGGPPARGAVRYPRCGDSPQDIRGLTPYRRAPGSGMVTGRVGDLAIPEAPRRAWPADGMQSATTSRRCCECRPFPARSRSASRKLWCGI